MPYTLRPVPPDQPTFAGFPRCGRLEELEADVAIIGIPYKSPYEISVPAVGGGKPVRSPGPEAAAALRRQSQSYSLSLRNHDFDFDGDLFAGREVRVVDCGDLVMAPADYRADLQAITAAVRDSTRGSRVRGDRAVRPGGEPIGAVRGGHRGSGDGCGTGRRAQPRPPARGAPETRGDSAWLRTERWCGIMRCPG